MHSRTIVSHRILLFLSLFTLACYGSKSVDGSTDDEESSDGYDGYDGYDGTDGTSCASGGGACWFGDTVCIDYSSGAEAWCSGVGGDFEASACAGGEDESCDIPAGGSADFTECATAYYYGAADPATACSGVGGTLN